MMNALLAIGAVTGASAVAYTAGVARATARMLPAMIDQGWIPPRGRPTKSENPFRGNGGAR